MMEIILPKCPKCGFFGELDYYLTERISALISDKQKDQLPNQREYSQYREGIEQNVIMNLVDWRSYFETVDYLGYPSQIDIDTIKTLSDSDVMTFTVVINHALRAYIDSYGEHEPNCLMLYEFYKLLKQETSKRLSLSFYPHEDGFKDYLETRIWRHEQERLLEQARETGSICRFCGSTNIKSNGNMWHCVDCGRNFRKAKS